MSSLLANEAVHAAELQSARAAERLDMALRLAFWRDSRCITVLHEILDVAAEVDGLDPEELGVALDDGRARGLMMRTYRTERDRVQGSPHFFLADGTEVHNPGITLHQVGSPGAGFLVVGHDDPSAVDALVLAAVEARGRRADRRDPTQGVLRATGKRTLSKLNAFDLVVTVAIGSPSATVVLSAEGSLSILTSPPVV